MVGATLERTAVQGRERRSHSDTHRALKHSETTYSGRTAPHLRHLAAGIGYERCDRAIVVTIRILHRCCAPCDLDHIQTEGVKTTMHPSTARLICPSATGSVLHIHVEFVRLTRGERAGEVADFTCAKTEAAGFSSSSTPLRFLRPHFMGSLSG